MILPKKRLFEESEETKDPETQEELVFKRLKQEKKALMFTVNKTFHRCRAATIKMLHGDVRTPVYMPVGTKGAMKGLL